jgi:hypothetical protein
MTTSSCKQCGSIDTYISENGYNSARVCNSCHHEQHVILPSPSKYDNGFRAPEVIAEMEERDRIESQVSWECLNPRIDQPLHKENMKTPIALLEKTSTDLGTMIGNLMFGSSEGYRVSNISEIEHIDGTDHEEDWIIIKNHIEIAEMLCKRLARKIRNEEVM